MNKYFVLFVAFALLLSACTANEAVPNEPGKPPAPPPESSVDDSLSEPEPGDVGGSDAAYVPMQSGGFAWLEDGQILAVPDGATIRYLDLDNQLQATVTLPEEHLPDSHRLLLRDERILAAGGSAGGRPPMTVCRIDGVWQLANAAIFDGQGKLLKAFPLYTQQEVPGEEAVGSLSDGRTVTLREDTAEPEPVWITEDLLALYTRSRLFFYRLSANSLVLADDMSDWMEPYGKMQAYYGIDRIMPYGDGCFYFVHRNEEAANKLGSVWYADETGARELFDGQEFMGFAATDESMILLDWPAEGPGAQTLVWYVRADREELVALAELAGHYICQRALGGFVTLTDSDESAFYLVGSWGDMELLQPAMPDYERFDLLGVRDDGLARQYLYAAYLDGDAQYYLVSSPGGEMRRLTTVPYLSGDEQYHTPMTHFVDRFPAGDPDNATAVRVCPIDDPPANTAAAPNA